MGFYALAHRALRKPGGLPLQAVTNWVEVSNLGAIMKTFVCAGMAASIVLLAAQAGAALPVVKKSFSETRKHYEIGLSYPQTGVKAIDDDIRAIITKHADTFRKLAVSDTLPHEMPYSDDADYDIVRNDGKYFVVDWGEEIDLGGAHPSNEIFTANYQLPDGWRIFLPEMVDGDRGIRRVSELARAALDRQLVGPDPMSDKNWIATGTAPVAKNFENFTLLPKSLCIEFPPYQVAAFAAGPQEVKIPLGDLASVMRTDWRAPQASFPCAQAATPLEKAICSNVPLARLDREVAETYFEMIRRSKEGSITPKVEALKAGQRAWLASRDTACANKQGPAGIACLTSLYSRRVTALESTTE